MAKDLGFIKGCTEDRANQAIKDFYSVLGESNPPIPEPMAVNPVMAAPTPAIETPKEIKNMTENEALTALRALLGTQPVTIDESKIVDMFRAEVAKIQKPMPTEIVILPHGELKPVGLHHAALPNIIKALSTGCNIMLVGATGSGKTTLAHQAADAALDIEKIIYYAAHLTVLRRLGFKYFQSISTMGELGANMGIDVLESDNRYIAGHDALMFCPTSAEVNSMYNANDARIWAKNIVMKQRPDLIEGLAA